MLGRLDWQGYGDGDYWRVNLQSDGQRFHFLLDGDKQPDTHCLQRARQLLEQWGAFRVQLPTDLKLVGVAFFPVDERHQPDGYSGDFAMLEAADGSDWRIDLGPPLSPPRPWR